MRFILILSALLSLIQVKAQQTEQYFSDTSFVGYNGMSSHVIYKNTIIYGGYATTGLPRWPLIVRIDTHGNVLWNTLKTDTSRYPAVPNQNVWLHMGVDGYLYAHIADLTYGLIYKMDPENGDILWRSRTPHAAQQFIDIDSGTFLFSYRLEVTAQYDEYRFAYFDKTTGDTISTHAVNGYCYWDDVYSLEIDHDKNLYIASNDTLYKYSGSQPGSRLWKSHVPSANLGVFNGMHFDSLTNSLYVFAYNKNAFTFTNKILTCNAGTGAHVRISNVGLSNVGCRDLASRDGYLYLSWEKISSGASAFNVQKYQMSTGTTPWYQSYTFYGGGGQGGSTIDLDSNSDVYLSGYSHSSFHGPGAWSVLKLENQTGAVLFAKTISDDPARFDDKSNGIGTVLLSNRAYFIGQLQLTNLVAHTIVELNDSTGDELSRKFIRVNYQYPSLVLEMLPYRDNKMLILKQSGGFTELTLLDSGLNRLWNVPFQNAVRHVHGQGLNMGNNGNIYVGTFTREESGHAEFGYADDDSLIIYCIDSNGQVLLRSGFYTDNRNVRPLYIKAYDTNFVVFYHSNSSFYYRVMGMSGAISAEYDPGMRIDEHDIKKHMDFDIHADSFLLFGSTGIQSKQFIINKNSGARRTVPALKHRFDAVDQVIPAGNERVLITGINRFDREAICMVNTPYLDTLWSIDFGTPIGSRIVKTEIDTLAGIAYLLSRVNSEVVIRKIDLSTKQVNWEKVINGKGSPRDMVLDRNRQQLLITGYQQPHQIEELTSVLILVIDTSGEKRHHLVKTGDVGGFNSGIRTGIINGKHLVGGKHRTYEHGKAGFLFGVTGCNRYSELDTTACYQLVSPSGKYTWSKTGIYSDTIQLNSDCDSVIEVSLTLLSNADTTQVRVCYSYTSPSGKYTWVNSGTYLDTLTNSRGCDSVLLIQLLIDTSSYSLLTDTACGYYVSPTGKVWDSTGIYTDTITSQYGCDSIITLNLFVHPVGYDSASISSCYRYTSAGTNRTWTQSGDYIDTLTDAKGCDSLLFVKLTIHQADSVTLSASDCKTFSSPSGRHTWNASGLYRDTLTNRFGCDSILYIALQITQELPVPLSVTACDYYVSPSGRYIWTQSGIYSDTVYEALGCDSLFTIQLTIPVVDIGVTEHSPKLMANAVNATYRWFDCNGFTLIPFETNFEYSPLSNGSYAVEVKQGQCVDTSLCYTVLNAATMLVAKPDISLYPNPLEPGGRVSIESAFVIDEVEIRSIDGRLIQKHTPEATTFVTDPLAKGIYVILVNHLHPFKIVVH